MDNAVALVPVPENVKIVVFAWSTVNGECYDCGLPAAFLRDAERGRDRLCAVCAANAACDGDEIGRL